MNFRNGLSAVCLMLAACLVSLSAEARIATGGVSSGRIGTGAVMNNAPQYPMVAQYFEPSQRGGVGTRRPPRDEDVPLPGSGGVVRVPASAAASDTWQGCRPYRNRFKEPFQRCCKVSGGLRSCVDRY